MCFVFRHHGTIPRCVDHYFRSCIAYASRCLITTFVHHIDLDLEDGRVYIARRGPAYVLFHFRRRHLIFRLYPTSEHFCFSKNSGFSIHRPQKRSSIHINALYCV